MTREADSMHNRLLGVHLTNNNVLGRHTSLEQMRHISSLAIQSHNKTTRAVVQRSKSPVGKCARSVLGLVFRTNTVANAPAPRVAIDRRNYCLSMQQKMRIQNVTIGSFSLAKHNRDVLR
eukprot:Amastigsp_a518016_18.p4 type:complete len:120 gc:universal Amastigsp_a518016_18:1479-1120(-)